MDLIDRLFGKRLTADGHPAYDIGLESSDDGKAVSCLMAAVRTGDTHAMVTLGTMLLLGRGIEQDLYDGVAWIRQGANRGNTQAMLVLGAALLRGTGCTCNESEAAYWWYSAGMAGSTEAVAVLGRLLLRNPSLIGEHFTKEQFRELWRDAHRVRVAHY